MSELLVDPETGEVLTEPLPRQSRFVLSQSLIKKLDDDTLCPRYYYLYHLTGTYQEQTSTSMLKGQRFEYLALGNLNREGHVPELPKLRNGSKSVDEQRIEQQAELFKQVLPHYKMQLIYQQNHDSPSAAVELDHGDDVRLTGIFDAPILWDGGPAILDLKLTASLVSRWGPGGKPGWGDYMNMDHLQAYLYIYLAEKLLKRKMRFVYAVFEYGPNPKFKFLEIKDTPMRRQEMLQRIAGAREKLAQYAAADYPAMGHHQQCSRCAERDICPARKLVPEVATFD